MKKIEMIEKRLEMLKLAVELRIPEIPEVAASFAVDALAYAAELSVNASQSDVKDIADEYAGAKADYRTSLMQGGRRSKSDVALAKAKFYDAADALAGIAKPYVIDALSNISCEASKLAESTLDNLHIAEPS